MPNGLIQVTLRPAVTSIIDSSSSLGPAVTGHDTGAAIAIPSARAVIVTNLAHAANGGIGGHIPVLNRVPLLK